MRRLIRRLATEMLWPSAMTSVKEMHHFYPVLCYFRFTDAHYSMEAPLRVRPPAIA